MFQYIHKAQRMPKMLLLFGNCPKDDKKHNLKPLVCTSRIHAYKYNISRIQPCDAGIIAFKYPIRIDADFVGCKW